MTFKRPNNKKYIWELSRFCSSSDTVVVGAFSKLLGAFRKNNAGNIISYADRFHSVGSVYSRNGFDLKYISRPSYRYSERNSEIQLHKRNFQKNKICDKMNAHLTETEIMMDAGYKILYDCGQMVFGIE